MKHEPKHPVIDRATEAVMPLVHQVNEAIEPAMTAAAERVEPVVDRAVEARKQFLELLPFELPKFELPFDLPKVELPKFDEVTDRFETLVADLRERATDRRADLRKRAEDAVDRVRATIGR
ncbi:MAG: hypothetical protein V9G10_08660 [Candidatus Nanopelagicales bacterium]